MMWAIVVWKSTWRQCTRQFALSHFSAMTRPCWFRSSGEEPHRHAIEQASLGRGGRRGDSGRRAVV